MKHVPIASLVALIVLIGCAAVRPQAAGDPVDQVLNEARVSLVDYPKAQPVPMPELGRLEVSSPRPRAQVTLADVVVMADKVADVGIPIAQATVTRGWVGGVLEAVKQTLQQPKVIAGAGGAVIVLVFMVLRWRKVRIPAATADLVQQALDKHLDDARQLVAKTRIRWDDIAVDLLAKVASELVKLRDGDVPTQKELQYAKRLIAKAGQTP